MDDARRELQERAFRHEWDRSDATSRELYASAVDLALAILRSSHDMDLSKNHGDSIAVLEEYAERCRAK